MSNATPKIDSYPFTTLLPTVGVIDYPDDFKTLTMADVPGLIEGAAENRGLGHRFFDMWKGVSYSYFYWILQLQMDGIHVTISNILRKELIEYDPKLNEKPFLWLVIRLMKKTQINMSMS